MLPYTLLLSVDDIFVSFCSPTITTCSPTNPCGILREDGDIYLININIIFQLFPIFFFFFFGLIFFFNILIVINLFRNDLLFKLRKMKCLLRMCLFTRSPIYQFTYTYLLGQNIYPQNFWRTLVFLNDNFRNETYNDNNNYENNENKVMIIYIYLKQSRNLVLLLLRCTVSNRNLNLCASWKYQCDPDVSAASCFCKCISSASFRVSFYVCASSFHNLVSISSVRRKQGSFWIGWTSTPIRHFALLVKISSVSSFKQVFISLFGIFFFFEFINLRCKRIHRHENIVTHAAV